MSGGAIVRNYIHETDFEIIKSIHEATEIDYKMPNLNTPIWLTKKVLEVDGIVRAAVATYIQVEMYLWLDKSNWASPEEKMIAIKILDEETIKSVWLNGVEQAVLWLPPNMERFGERLTKDLGFTKDRDGWVSYSKPTG